MSIDLLLAIFAFVCFLLAALGINVRINLVAAGLAAWVLTQII